MIQRIQTIWLSLCIILSLLLLKGNLLNFTGADGMTLALGFKGLVSVSGKGVEVLNHSLLIPAVLILIPAASFTGIILFRKSPLQRLSVWTVIAASAILYLCGLYYWKVADDSFKCNVVPGIKMIIPAINIILAFLALAGIRKDEKIVRSYDRLR